MTLLISDPLFLDHQTGAHPENPNRLRSIASRLAERGLIERCTRGTFEPYAEAKLTRVHTAHVVARAKATAQGGGGFLDADTILSLQSFEVALNAVGACAAGVDAVVSGREKNALVLVRPPGHHATPTSSMGFCLFNNIALAARHAQDAHGLKRILIVDWDVHHGNGTQDVFYDDPNVFFFSMHRYGHGFYPGTGATDETGTGPGLGTNRNLALRYGIPRLEVLAKFRAEVENAVDRIKPELILLSAGFDAHRRDPIGDLGLESEDYGTLTRTVMDVADGHCSGRVVSCLEGGYNLEALAESVEIHLEGLIGG